MAKNQAKVPTCGMLTLEEQPTEEHIQEAESKTQEQSSLALIYPKLEPQTVLWGKQFILVGFPENGSGDLKE